MTMWRIVAGLCAAALGACAAPAGGGTPKPEAAAVPAQGLALQGTRWRGIISSQFDQSHTPRLDFVTPGRISGYTGCNMLSGTWREEGGAVRFGQLVTTKRACAGPESEIERRLMAALSDQSRATREGPKLVVTAPNGRQFDFYEDK